MAMKLQQYLDGIRAATTAEALEQALQAPYKHPFHGPTWSRICNARIAAGQKIVDAHPHGRYVPRFGDRRALTVCGEVYKVGRGGNSTGVRYAWASAKTFAVDVLVRNGFSRVAAHRVWDCFSDYPHRCLETVGRALKGGYPDPELNVLKLGYIGERSIQYTVEQNDACDYDYRANMPCPHCQAGTIFDWGGGFGAGDFPFVNWHCNGCGAVYTEYMTMDRFSAVRQAKSPRTLAVPMSASTPAQAPLPSAGATACP